MDDDADRTASPTRFLRDDDDDAAAAAASAASGSQVHVHVSDDVDYLLHPDLSLSALSTLVSPPRARPTKRRDRDLDSSPRASPRRGNRAQTLQSSPRASAEAQTDDAAAAASASQPKRVRFLTGAEQAFTNAATSEARAPTQPPTTQRSDSGTDDATATSAALESALPAASSASPAVAAVDPSPPATAPSAADVAPTSAPSLLHPRSSFLFFRAVHYAKLKAAFPELYGFQCSKLGEPLVSLKARPESLRQPVTVYLPTPTPTAQPVAAAAATTLAPMRSSRVSNPVLAQAVPMGVVVAGESASESDSAAAAGAAPLVAVATPAPSATPLYYPCPTVGQGNAEISRLLGAEWRALTPAQRQPYEDMATQDRQRYFAAKALQAQNQPAKPETPQMGASTAAPTVLPADPNAR